MNPLRENWFDMSHMKAVSLSWDVIKASYNKRPFIMIWVACCNQDNASVYTNGSWIHISLPTHIQNSLKLLYETLYEYRLSYILNESMKMSCARDVCNVPCHAPLPHRPLNEQGMVSLRPPVYNVSQKCAVMSWSSHVLNREPPECHSSGRVSSKFWWRLYICVLVTL